MLYIVCVEISSTVCEQRGHFEKSDPCVSSLYSDRLCSLGSQAQRPRAAVRCAAVRPCRRSPAPARRMPRGRVCGSLDCAHLMAVVAPQLCVFWQNRTSQAGAGVASPVLRAAHKHTRTTYNANQLTRKQAHEATRAPHLANPSKEVGSFHRKQTICFGCARVSSQLPRACEDDAARSHARARYRSVAVGALGVLREFTPPASTQSERCSHTQYHTINLIMSLQLI